MYGLLILCGCGVPARADGGHIALHAVSGRYSVTLFTAPEPLVAGPVDLSLLVQDAATGQILSDAHAGGSLDSGQEHPGSIGFAMTHDEASNKLLLAATPTLPSPGSYTLLLRVEQPGAPPATFTVPLMVAANHRRRTTVLFALVLPLAAILLFLINQQSKFRRHRAPALH